MLLVALASLRSLSSLFNLQVLRTLLPTHLTQVLIISLHISYSLSACRLLLARERKSLEPTYCLSRKCSEKEEGGVEQSRDWTSICILARQRDSKGHWEQLQSLPECVLRSEADREGGWMPWLGTFEFQRTNKSMFPSKTNDSRVLACTFLKHWEPHCQSW